MSSVAYFFLLILPSVYSQLCAKSQSYCLIGLNYGDHSDGICNQYIHAGTLNSCSYFATADGLYLYWYPLTSKWMISGVPGDSASAAYCKASQLDDCIKYQWYYSEGYGWFINPNLQIQECYYSNFDCSASFNSTDTYCIANTEHREWNVNLRGKYFFEGCFMNQPYFVHTVHYTDDTHINFTLQWDDILSVWHISGTVQSGAYAVYAYCKEMELKDCDKNWYIYDGSKSDTFLDKKVNSGFCDNCVERVEYDEICIVGGISQNKIIGRYEYWKCNHLYPEYRSIDNPGYGIEYLSFQDEYRIFGTVNRTTRFLEARCNGSDMTKCIEFDDQWEFLNGSLEKSYVIPGFRTSDCNEIDDQCDVNYDLCLNVFDDDAYTDYGGTFRFESCDNVTGYPVFYQYQNMSGEISNFSMISFDEINTMFVIVDREEKYIYATCNSLLLELCEGFWYPAQRNFTLYKCNEMVAAEPEESYWYIFVIIGVLLVIIGIGVFYFYWKQKNGDSQYERTARAPV